MLELYRSLLPCYDMLTYSLSPIARNRGSQFTLSHIARIKQKQYSRGSQFTLSHIAWIKQYSRGSQFTLSHIARIKQDSRGSQFTRSHIARIKLEGQAILK